MTHGTRAVETGPKKGDALADTFRGSAQLYQKTFPEKLANLFVTMGDAQIYVAPEVADLLTENLADVREMVAQKAAFMRTQNWGAMATEFTAVQDDGTKTRVNHLMMPEKPVTGFVSGAFPAAMNNIGVFDHEMGHFIVEGGYAADVQRAECAADAYAALRHIQRFGLDTDLLSHAPAMAAEAALFEPFPLHYTTAVFQKITRIQKEGKIDIEKLSLPDTAALAGKIAVDYALSDVTLGKIHAAYARVRAAEREERPDWAWTIRAVAAAMLAHRHDDDIYRAGKLYLERPEIKRIIETKLGTDGKFQRALAAMAKHEKDSGFIIDASVAIDKKRAAAKKSPKPKGGAP